MNNIFKDAIKTTLNVLFVLTIFAIPVIGYIIKDGTMVVIGSFHSAVVLAVGLIKYLED